MELYLNLVYCGFSKALFGNFFHINSPMRAYHLCNRKFYSYRSSTVLHNHKGIYIYLNPKQNKNKTVSNRILIGRIYDLYLLLAYPCTFIFWPYHLGRCQTEIDVFPNITVWCGAVIHFSLIVTSFRFLGKTMSWWKKLFGVPKIITQTLHQIYSQYLQSTTWKMDTPSL